MSNHDDHVKQVRRLTTLINNSPDPDTREQASNDLADKWTAYNRQK